MVFIIHKVFFLSIYNWYTVTVYAIPMMRKCSLLSSEMTIGSSGPPPGYEILQADSVSPGDKPHASRFDGRLGVQQPTRFGEKFRRSVSARKSRRGGTDGRQVGPWNPGSVLFHPEGGDEALQVRADKAQDGHSLGEDGEAGGPTDSER